MTWTKERPTKPGWYWTLPELGVVQVKQYPLSGELYVLMDGDDVEYDLYAFPDTLWYGPIEPPPMPEEGA